MFLAKYYLQNSRTPRELRFSVLLRS